jgi:ubiquinone/menaquinone biosynthesis C-methylase UbiE
MSPDSLPFNKYDEMGAYHWIQCDRNSRMYNPPLEARYKVLLKRLGTAKRVLDVGCGDGYLMGLVSPHCELAVGIDSELSGIKLASARLRPFANCTVGQASCYNLPFTANCFDVILLADVFEHLEDPDLCIKELCRILTPNGTLLLTTPQWRPDRMWDRLHCKEYKPVEVRDCLERYFSDVSMKFCWPLTWSDWYSTRIGFQLIRIFSRYLYNPFLRESARPEKFGQIIAVCQQVR